MIRDADVYNAEGVVWREHRLTRQMGRRYLELMPRSTPIDASGPRIMPLHPMRRLIFPMKLITLYLLVMLAVSLTGCADHEKKLTFWIGGAPQEVDYWETLVGEFQRIAVDEVHLHLRGAVLVHQGVDFQLL